MPSRKSMNLYNDKQQPTLSGQESDAIIGGHIEY